MNLPKLITAFFLSIMLSTSGCRPDAEPVNEAVQEEVALIEEGKLKVLMSNNISSYYVLKGQPRGFEYEMLKYFCEDHKLKLEVEVVRDFEYILDSLEAGRGDLAAGNIAVTKARKERVDFSPEILRTRQVLVQRLPDGYKKLSKKQQRARMVADALELDGKTVHVNSSSTFYERLKNYADENGLNIKIVGVKGNIGTDVLMRMLAAGEIDYTVVDENVARLHAEVYPNIDISVPMSLSQSIAWAIPKGHPELSAKLEKWVAEKKNSARYRAIYNKYFSSSSQMDKGNYMSVVKGQISPFDHLIKKYAQFIEWDWLLLAAMIQKESKFNPEVESPFGAIGLMQVLPNTGKRFGISPEELTNPELNIKAGTRFIQWLDNYWYKKIADTAEVKLFVLASYNIGPGHVLDAMRLAEKYGLNPHIWHGHVETMLLNKSEPKYYQDPVVKNGYCNGIQAVVYVSKVLDYYENYKTFVLGAEGHQTAMAFAAM